MSKRGRPAKSSPKKAAPVKKTKVEADSPVHIETIDEVPGRVSIPAINSPAPEFTADAVVNGEIHDGDKAISLSKLKGKWVVLFFYPLDFTFVCPTEIIAFSQKAAEFRQHNTELLGASVDSVYSHLAWVKTPQKSGGLGAVDFPLLADVDKKLSTAYGALFQSTGFTLRATYIIDDKGVLRHVSMNQPPVGRNVDEILRLVQAFQHHDKHGEVCPINWKPGQDTMHADPVKSLSYFEKHGKQ